MPQQGHVDAGESEVPGVHKHEGGRQEGQQEILEHRDQIADQNKQAALPNPLGELRVLLHEILPPVHDRLHIESLPFFQLKRTTLLARR